MKIVAMIPARLGSKRIYKKNLRLIDGKPLIAYIIDTVNKCTCFDKVYINSEATIFGEIAEQYGIRYYQRPPLHASDTATNDGFALNFMENVHGDILIQILPTSPFITAVEISKFTERMIREQWDTLISVEHKQIACVYKGEPVNFERIKVNPPSQTMEPVKAYATALMGWKYDTFKANMESYGSGYHGGLGKTGYFELRGLSTIDIDREEDFQLAERIILSGNVSATNERRYYDE